MKEPFNLESGLNAVSNKTAPEIIFERADSTKEHMGLTSLDVAEDMANRHIPMTMEDWAIRLDKFLEAADRDILMNAGKITKEIAEEHALTQFEKYRVIQDELFESDFDRFIKLENMAKNISKK